MCSHLSGYHYEFTLSAVSVIVLFVGGVTVAAVIVAVVASKSKFKLNYLPRDYLIS
jgi:hypothetical protein